MMDRGSPKHNNQKAYVRNYYYSIILGDIKFKGNCFTAEETVDSVMRIFKKICKEVNIGEDESIRLMKKRIKSNMSIDIKDIIPTIGGN